MTDIKEALEDLNRKLNAGQLVVSPLGKKSTSTLVRRWLWLGAAGGLLATGMALGFSTGGGPFTGPCK